VGGEWKGCESWQCPDNSDETLLEKKEKASGSPFLMINQAYLGA
jgi:hypothetical protein